MTTARFRAQQVYVRFERDAGPLNQILRIPSIFDASSEDGAADPNDVNLDAFANSSSARIVGAYCGQQLTGFFLLTQMSSVLWQFHTAIKPEFRGAAAMKAVQQMISLAFSELAAQKLITFVPTFNRGAAVFAVHCGLSRQGCITGSFLKNGELHDQIIFGISRGTPCH
jgi:hypothetical protein